MWNVTFPVVLFLTTMTLRIRPNLVNNYNNKNTQ